MIIWWQCTIDNGKTSFGFSTKENIIQPKFPDYRFVGKTLQSSRHWFIQEKAKVVKICEQLEKNDIHPRHTKIEPTEFY